MQFFWKTAASRTPESIASKHGVPVEQIRAEIDRGTEAEKKEHSDLFNLIREFLDRNGLEMPIAGDKFFRMIATSHVDEVKDYYQKLKKYVEPTED